MKTRVSVFVQCVCMTILGFITAVPAQAGLMHNITPDQQYLDFADNFASVGWLGVQTSQGTAFNSSAVLIDPHWVLTSAHSVLQVDTDHSSIYDGYRVGFTDNFFQNPGENQLANAVYVNPDYQNIRSGPDLALLYFEQPFTIDPVELYFGSHTPGTAYHHVGFGDYGTVSQGFQSTDGNRRAGTNTLTSVDTFDGYLGALFVRPGQPSWQELGILGGPGDSGGGVFLSVDGELKLGAISAFVQGFPTYGATTYAAYFDDNTEQWIASTMQSHAVPEPASSVTFLMAMGAGAAARRRTMKRGRAA